MPRAQKRQRTDSTARRRLDVPMATGRRLYPRKNLKMSKVPVGKLTHRFVRYADTDGVIACNTTEQAFSKVFSLADVVNSTEFTNLFDRYMITKVIVRVHLQTNPDAVVPTNSAVPPVTQQVTNWYPRFWYAADYDDDNLPTLTEIKQKSDVKCVILKPNEFLNFAITPAVLTQTYRSTISTGYSPNWYQWVDAGQSNVPHYGLKCILDTEGLDPNDSYPFVVRLTYKYYFSCKDGR